MDKVVEVKTGLQWCVIIVMLFMLHRLHFLSHSLRSVCKKRQGEILNNWQWNLVRQAYTYCMNT